MKRNLWISIAMTFATIMLFGLAYPLLVTGLAQLIFPQKANGQLIAKSGTIVGSRLIGQKFSDPAYFHSRASATNYDAANSGGSNLGPTNQKLIARVHEDAARAQEENPGVPVPVDLVTTSASGLDPHITPAAAEFQLPRVANARGISTEQLRRLVNKHTEGRQFGFLGEARVNVLELNLDLDQSFPKH